MEKLLNRILGFGILLWLCWIPTLIYSKISNNEFYDNLSIMIFFYPMILLIVVVLLYFLIMLLFFAFSLLISG